MTEEKYCSCGCEILDDNNLCDHCQAEADQEYKDIEYAEAGYQEEGHWNI